MKNILFFIGILVFAFTIGIMTGASSTPVAGGVISSVFAIALAVLGLVGNKDTSFKVKLNVIGNGLITLSVGLLIGLFAGIQYRYEDPITSTNKKFIWEGYPAPASTYEAMDWILTNDLLISRGFSRDQVQLIYKIRLQEIAEVLQDTVLKNSWERRSDTYSTDKPFYKMIIGGTQSNLLQRSIATDQREREKPEIN